MTEGRIPELWVVVTRATNGVTHTWGPYLSVQAANVHRRHLMSILTYDRGVSIHICRVLNPRPILNVVRTTEVSIYGIQTTETTKELGRFDAETQETTSGHQSTV